MPLPCTVVGYKSTLFCVTILSCQVSNPQCDALIPPLLVKVAHCTVNAALNCKKKPPTMGKNNHIPLLTNFIHGERVSQISMNQLHY